MASLFLLLLCVMTSQAAQSKDTVVTDLVVETTTSAVNKIDDSVSRYPSVADYNNLNYFRSRISVLSDGSLLAGAINKLYHINREFDTRLALLTWNATDTGGICNQAFSSTFLCSNHIRIHEVQSDNNTVLVCGTNAIQPKCRLTTLDSGFTANIGGIISPETGLVPFHPDFKGLFIDNDAFPGGVLAVNYLDAAQNGFGISYQFIDTTGGMINNTVQYLTIRQNDNWLRNPSAYVDHYADSYSNDDSLSFYFIFLTENSVEISGTDNVVIYSRVVRVCKNDPGFEVRRGTVRSYSFKSYVKAYIYCEKPKPSGSDSVPGSTNYQYNVIRKVSLVRNSTYRVGVASRDRVVYGLFTGPTYGPPGSAICVYGADMSATKDRGIFTIFSEEYRNLRPGQTSCTANNVPNDNPFTCDPATHSTSRPMPEYDVLISPAVDQLTTDPLVELNGITATSIYTTQALVCNSSVRACTSANDLIDLDVMLVGTNDGKILKIVMTYNGTDHIPLISEELSLADGLTIQNMEPQYDSTTGEFDHLLLSTDSYIYRIPPQRCSRFATCVDCVKARDPHCFWNQHTDSGQRGCKVLSSRTAYDPQIWYQDINYGDVTQWNDCEGSPSNFTIAANNMCASSGVEITITPENSQNTFTVMLTIERLSSCGTATIALPGPQPQAVSGRTIYRYTSLQQYTWYRVNVTTGSIMRTVTFRTCAAAPVVPSISEVFPTNDGILVYPVIGCLTDDIANYTITVQYGYIRCTALNVESGSMSLPGANGSIFTITGLGSYTRISSVTVTVQNSINSNMWIMPIMNLRTIEGQTTAVVTSPAVTTTSCSLFVTWSAPSTLCGTLTGYSVYLDSVKITNCNMSTSYNITGLQSNTQYTVQVTVCTVAGEGSMTMVPSSMTKTRPGTPTLVKTITATNTSNSITFSWNDVEFNDDMGGTYEVQRICYVGGNTTSDTVSSVSIPTHEISGINCSEADCYIRVAAINTANNRGPFSAYFRGTTTCPDALPSSKAVAANNIRIDPLTSSAISVSWDVPSDYCGPKRTFTVTVTTQGSNNQLCRLDTSQNFVNCTGVQFAQSYNVTVTTMIYCNTTGSSLTSNSSTIYRHCVISDAPNNVRFTGVTLNWDGIQNCGEISNWYNVYSSCGNSGQNDTTSHTSYTLNVVDQTSFSYCLGQVQACNAEGCGRFSDYMAITVPLQRPPRPSITGAVNGTTVLIMVIITEPTDINDLRYTLYRTQRRPIDEDAFTAIVSNMSYTLGTVLTDDGPGEEETYEYQLELHNNEGTSERSNTIRVTTTEEPPPGSPINVIVMQNNDGDLVIEWGAPLSSSDLSYTITYDTVPPSNNKSVTMSGIRGSPTTILRDNLVIDRTCSVGVRARDERNTFFGAWSYAENCFVNSPYEPGPPIIDNPSYERPLFILKWAPPTDDNEFLIVQYIVRLRNGTADNCDDVCNEDTYEHSIPVKSGSTDYMEVFSVNASTCFCASVTAENGAGRSTSFTSLFYKYESETTPPGTGSSKAIDDNDDNSAAPIVAIVLGVVLILVAVVTVILAIVFFKLYSARMKQAKASDSNKDLNAFN